MNDKHPLFRDRGDGAYDVTPAGVLLLAADALHGDPDETTPQGQARAQALIREALLSAHAFGYRHAQIAETVLAGGDTKRKIKVAMEVAAHLDASAWQGVLQRVGWG